MPEKIPTIESRPLKKEIRHTRIAQLEKPMTKILEQMAGNIERGEYDLIIGIDASGRIPTLIIKKFSDNIYSKKGYSSPVIRFIAGRVNKRNAEAKIQEWNPQKRVLIVEDTLITGSSIKFLCQVLRENHILFDIVTIGIDLTNFHRLREVEKELGAANIYPGGIGESSIYKQGHLSGTMKGGGGGTFAIPYVRAVGGGINDQKTINQARADADVVADNLINWYESQKQENEK